MDSPQRDNSFSGNGPNPPAGEASAARLGSEAAETAKQTAQSVFGDAKRAAVDATERTADAIGDASASLEDSGQSDLSEATAALASKLHDFSGYLENRSINDLFEDARRLAARNPGLFIAGGVVIGVALSRFFKASMASSASASTSSSTTPSQSTMGRREADVPSRDDAAAEDLADIAHDEDSNPAGRGDGEGRATH
jgi:hypothetical protein